MVAMQDGPVRQTHQQGSPACRIGCEALLCPPPKKKPPHGIPAQGSRPTTFVYNDSQVAVWGQPHTSDVVLSGQRQGVGSVAEERAQS